MRIKLNVVSSTVRGKRVVLVDDSIVRGTTSARIINLLRDAGAKEVHFVVSAPPFKYPCYFGTDIPDQKMLVATGRNVEQINEMHSALDTLGYLSIDHVKQLAQQSHCGFCTACFTGEYATKPACQPTADIHDRHLNQPPQRREKVRRITSMEKSYSESYKAAGVDITAGYRSVELMKQYVARTMTEQCIGGLGGFGGLFELDCTGIQRPVLDRGTDGVGTKLRIAMLLDKHDTIGIDCVAMCVNDVICAGAKPLVFLDYIACGRNIPEKIAEIVKGVQRAACRLAAPGGRRDCRAPGHDAGGGLRPGRLYCGRGG